LITTVLSKLWTDFTEDEIERRIDPLLSQPSTHPPGHNEEDARHRKQDCVDEPSRLMGQHVEGNSDTDRRDHDPEHDEPEPKAHGQQLSRKKISVTKNGKARKVDLSRMLASVLNELLAVRRSQALQEELKKPAEERRDRDVVINEVMEDWLFQTPVMTRSELAKRRRPESEARGGTQLDPSNLRKVFNRLLTDAKLRRVRFHDLRHSFASLLLEQGESLTYVKEQMGHSSINVTVDIYGHLVPGGNRAAVDKLDAEVPERAEPRHEAEAAK